MKTYGSKFHVVMIDAPWYCGVEADYHFMSDKAIAEVPVSLLQDEGYLLMWVTNAKKFIAADIVVNWGYKVVDTVYWHKVTANNKNVNGNGLHLRQSIEECLLGAKGDTAVFSNLHKVDNTITSAVRGLSRKPDEIYDLVS